MQSVDRSNPPSTARFLCVDLQSERYAIPILSVREIQAYSPPTPLPRMPAHVRGVTSLHGTIVPVVDLRLRVGMAEQSYGRLTVIVFVMVRSQIVGLIVDAASRVVDLEQSQIKPPPEVGDGVDVSFIAGIARMAGNPTPGLAPGPAADLADKVIVVLDVDALLRGDPALAASLIQQAGAPVAGARERS